MSDIYMLGILKVNYISVFHVVKRVDVEDIGLLTSSRQNMIGEKFTNNIVKMK